MSLTVVPQLGIRMSTSSFDLWPEDALELARRLIRMAEIVEAGV